ncbi:MAG: NADP-dependent oxidoreductase [Hyphomicrobiaceae bacterium]|nr:MAG: NADP-dependent oxidoreductase [Hyphomicrobiaceae bacterium]
MKAIMMDRHGGLEVLRYGDLPDPAAEAGQVVVDIHAASVNGADAKVREGGAYATVSKFPYVLGRDFSGVVAALGAGVTEFAVGDTVFGVLAAGRDGTYAEKVAEKAAILCRKPSDLSHVEAAALALIGLTALVSIEDTIKLERGETILIQGGAGGVAGYAIQLAKHIGARVIATASAANHDYVKSLGADEVIDYNKEDFTRVVKDVDAVFETVGGDVATRSFAVVKSGGRAAFIASGATAPVSPRLDVRSLRPAVGRDRAHLQRILDLHATRAVRVPEIRVFALREAAEAQSISEGRHLRGKLVLGVRS